MTLSSTNIVLGKHFPKTNSQEEIDGPQRRFERPDNQVNQVIVIDPHKKGFH